MGRLHQIQVKRFFGIDEADVVLAGGSDGMANVTLLVGANGAGKSSLLKAVQFFAEHYPYQVCDRLLRLLLSRFCVMLSVDSSEVSRCFHAPECIRRA
jgi:predicted AAA+ superfamily ATPase